MERRSNEAPHHSNELLDTDGWHSFPMNGQSVKNRIRPDGNHGNENPRTKSERLPTHCRMTRIRNTFWAYFCSFLETSFARYRQTKQSTMKYAPVSVNAAMLNEQSDLYAMAARPVGEMVEMLRQPVPAAPACLPMPTLNRHLHTTAMRPGMSGLA
jgi:hypothetical protein